MRPTRARLIRVRLLLRRTRPAHPVTGRAPLALDMPESTLQANVVELARRLGYLWFHPHDSRRSPRGFPDLVLAHPGSGALILAELKATDGRVTPDQRQWLRALTTGRHDVHLWRPAHWLDGTVTATLTVRARTP